MALEEGHECALEAFDLWTVPAVQQTVESTTVTEHRPITKAEAGHMIQFDFRTNEDEYISFKDTYAYVEISIDLAKKDKTAVVADDWKKISTVNYLLHSMIEQIIIEIGNKQTTIAPQAYAYKSYFEALLGFDDSAKKSHLTSALWYPDQADMEALNPTRQAWIKPRAGTTDLTKGKTLALMGRLHLDLAYQPKAFLGGVDITMKILPQNEKFYLKTADANLLPTVNIKKAVLHLARAKLNPAVLRAHQKALSMKPARYNVTRSEVKRHVIKADTIDEIIDNVVTGQLPRRVFIAFVTNEAFNGSFTKNPFNFQIFDIDHLCCYVDGGVLPSIPYTPNKCGGLREYHCLMDALNQTGTSTYCEINRATFASGYAIFGINFAADLSDGCGVAGHLNPIKRGSMRLEVKFGTKLPQAITCLTYCEFDNTLSIDKDHNPALDYM